MIQALHFKDEKSDKFWFIETLDCELMVNYGKTGVTGKYEIKEFDTVEECEKEALKLINSKKLMPKIIMVGIYILWVDV